MLLLVLVGAVFRLAVVDLDTLHVDEALYAYYGLHLVRTGDVLLLQVGYPLDRIPVFFWAVGATIGALGNTPMAIRLPDLAASLLTVAFVYALAKDLCGRAAGWFAGLLFAVSPFALVFGATVFTDPFAAAVGSLALVWSLNPPGDRPGILRAVQALSQDPAIVVTPLTCASRP